jgi:uncharacterized membrane protein YozB (DUF420 family)
MSLAIETLPSLNASLNCIATCFLLLGFVAIKRKNKARHKTCMISALAASTLFLTLYLIYHLNTAVFRTYDGSGLARSMYYFILATHIPVAGLMTPFIIYALWLALRGEFEKHVRVVRILFPVWTYVSVTGVVIYLMLYG